MRKHSRSPISTRKLDPSTLHIEVPGAIINVRVGLRNIQGQDVTAVEVLADGNRYAGEPQWWIDAGGEPRETIYVRVVKDISEKAPV